MTITTAIDTYLLSVGAITALVGQRIYPERAAQDDALNYGNYVTYHLALRPSEDAIDGGPDLIDATVDFVAMSKSYDDAFAIADALRAALNDFIGIMGGAGGLHVGSVNWIETEGGYFSTQTEVAEVGLFGALARFVIQYVP